MQLILLAVIVIVMVKADDLRINTLALEHRTECQLNEVALLIPRHVQGHGVTPVEWLVLWCHTGDVYARCLEGLDPLHEVHRVVLIIIRIEITTYPLVRACIRCFATDIIHLHPYWAAPRCTHHFESGVNGQDLFQYRDDIVQFIGSECKVLNAFGVAAGVVIIAARVEVATADRYAHVAVAHTFLWREGLHQQFLATLRRHLHEVECRSTGDSSTKAVKLLITHIRIEFQCTLRRHVQSFGIILAYRNETHCTICGSDVGHHIALWGWFICRVILRIVNGGIAAEQCGRNTYK